jgi:hypothetical protein
MTMPVNYPSEPNEMVGGHVNDVFLRPLSILAREKKTWTPHLLAGVLWRAVTNIRTHRQVMQLFRLPVMAEVASTAPRLPFKYLTNDYLVRGFDIPARAACFLHHYRRLVGALPDAILGQTLRADYPLLDLSNRDQEIGLSMGLPQRFDKEGELAFNLRVDGEIVFLISFNIAPGWVIGSSAAEILLITRLQGTKGAFRRISQATKIMHDVAPAHVLLAALQGLANALGINTLAAVTAKRQISFDENYAGSFYKAYDEFFTELGISPTAGGFFVSPIPMEDKPLTDIKHGHKLRTKEKRAFKLEVQEACARFFIENRRA